MTHVAAPPQRGDAGESIQLYARLAGVLGLLSVIGGGFGEAYVPGVMFVAGDAASTAQNVLAKEMLFRWGFAGFLVESLCDAALTMMFWVLMRPVHRNLAMLMVVLRIISTCGFAGSQVLWFGALQTLRTAPLVGLEQPEALAYLFTRIASFGGSLFSTFYGAANIILGWLVWRSGYLPRVFGILLAVSGAAFVAHTVLLVLVPAWASQLLLATAVVIIAFLVWLLVKGVDEEAYRRLRAREDPGIFPS